MRLGLPPEIAAEEYLFNTFRPGMMIPVKRKDATVVEFTQAQSDALQKLRELRAELPWKCSHCNRMGHVLTCASCLWKRGQEWRFTDL